MLFRSGNPMEESLPRFSATALLDEAAVAELEDPELTLPMFLLGGVLLVVHVSHNGTRAYGDVAQFTVEGAKAVYLHY
jgi:hypothetical protein